MLESPRRRRRLKFAAVFLLVAVPLGVLGAHYTTSGSPQNANGPYVKDDEFYRQPTKAPFRAKDRRAVRAVLGRFIDGAVARRDLAASRALVGPSLRQDLSRGEWLKGEIPIVPFPAARRQGSWSLVNYSYRNQVGLEVLLFPERSARSTGAATVETELVKDRHGRWLVDYWMITKMHGPGSAGAADSASTAIEGPPNVHKLPGKGKQKPQRVKKVALTNASTQPTRLDAKWILVPVGLLSLIVLVPAGIGISVWIRNRRATAAYRARSS